MQVYLASWHETPVAVKVLVDANTALDKKSGAALRKISQNVIDKLGEVRVYKDTKFEPLGVTTIV